jgi:uncharacterized membrane protein SirB2
MIEFYPQIKMVHIACALASVGLFTLRGAGMLAGMRWPRADPLRWLSWSIDTVLLTAALMLAAILPAALFGNHWLTVKLVALVVYIVLGYRALAPGLARGQRLAWWLAALACFGFMYSVARSHHPLGLLRWLAG